MQASSAPRGNWRRAAADSQQQTVQQLAIHNRMADIERVLDEQGNHLVNEHICEKDGYSALMEAAYRGYYDLAELLLARGADVNHADKKGYNALHLAASSGRPRIVQLLLEHGAGPRDVDATTNSGMTAVRLAVLRKHANMPGAGDTEDFAAVIRLLVEAGASPEAMNRNDDKMQSALHLAVMEGFVPIVRILLILGANANATNRSGKTALMLAAESNQVEAVEELLEAGAELDLQDSSRRTAQMIAEENGHETIARLLVNARTSAHVEATPIVELDEEGAAALKRLSIGADGARRERHSGSGFSFRHSDDHNASI